MSKDNSTETTKPEQTATDLPDLSSWAIDSGVPYDPSSQETYETIECRKPRRNEFFRVLAGDTSSMDTVTYCHTKTRATYLVSPAMRKEIGTSGKHVRLRVCINRQGEMFVWPLALPGDSAFGRTWHNSAIANAILAETEWTKVEADSCSSTYRAYKALGNLLDPEWPPLTFGEIINTAFRNHVIVEGTHPVLQEIRGEV